MRPERGGHDRAIGWTVHADGNLTGIRVIPVEHCELHDHGAGTTSQAASLTDYEFAPRPFHLRRGAVTFHDRVLVRKSSS